jgi:hypothetical protein
MPRCANVIVNETLDHRIARQLQQQTDRTHAHRMQPTGSFGRQSQQCDRHVTNAQLQRRERRDDDANFAARQQRSTFQRRPYAELIAVVQMPQLALQRRDEVAEAAEQFETAADLEPQGAAARLPEVRRHFAQDHRAAELISPGAQSLQC